MDSHYAKKRALLEALANDCSTEEQSSSQEMASHDAKRRRVDELAAEDKSSTEEQSLNNEVFSALEKRLELALEKEKRGATEGQSSSSEIASTSVEKRRDEPDEDWTDGNIGKSPNQESNESLIPKVYLFLRVLSSLLIRLLVADIFRQGMETMFQKHNITGPVERAPGAPIAMTSE
jgi:hypothetical protein